MIAIARILLLSVALILSACAGLGPRTPVNVNVVGVEPTQGAGMEGRFLVKLRVQNPNEQPIEFNGAYVELFVRGIRTASGVSDERGVVPRFGESLVTIPVTVPVSALVRQAMSLASASTPIAGIDYEVKGKLSGPLFGGANFQSKGEISLPDRASPAKP
jgi:LEA14-like dessication related protein